MNGPKIPPALARDPLGIAGAVVVILLGIGIPLLVVWLGGDRLSPAGKRGALLFAAIVVVRGLLLLARSLRRRSARS